MVTSYVAVAPIGVSQWGGPWEDTHKRVGGAAGRCTRPETYATLLMIHVTSPPPRHLQNQCTGTDATHGSRPSFLRSKDRLLWGTGEWGLPG